MTNEELKKKIVEILEETEYEWTEEKNGYILQIFYDKLADALIDANIFVDIDTLKDEQQSMNGILTNMSSYMNYKLHELEHRAEVAEQKYKLLFQKYDSFFNDVTYCHKNFSDVDSEITKQAERELAEDVKDD